MSISVRSRLAIGSEWSCTTTKNGKKTTFAGTVIGVRPMGTVVNIKTKEEWPGIQFLIDPKAGKARWTPTVADRPVDQPSERVIGAGRETCHLVSQALDQLPKHHQPAVIEAVLEYLGERLAEGED